MDSKKDILEPKYIFNTYQDITEYRKGNEIKQKVK